MVSAVCTAAPSATRQTLDAAVAWNEQIALRPALAPGQQKVAPAALSGGAPARENRERGDETLVPPANDRVYTSRTSAPWPFRCFRCTAHAWTLRSDPAVNTVDASGATAMARTAADAFTAHAGYSGASCESPVSPPHARVQNVGPHADESVVPAGDARVGAERREGGDGGDGVGVAVHLRRDAPHVELEPLPRARVVCCSDGGFLRRSALSDVAHR